MPVGAALAANTGKAGAIHRVACFAGTPAPTGKSLPLKLALSLWERACPRRAARQPQSSQLQIC
ncbi:hypothetical protein BL240_24090 [Pseudomonas putida]|uniref:Uncharacterized protein n=1 Tax=Pseudomonas putida TaxID=303 RepID=A0A1L5PVZ4_PSEPU|nr:hypothetical protein BL240_24090 [Pseudomonas putida]